MPVQILSGLIVAAGGVIVMLYETVMGIHRKEMAEGASCGGTSRTWGPVGNES